MTHPRSKKRMRILHVFPLLSTRSGGMEKVAVNLQRELTMRGHAVSVVSPAPRSSSLEGSLRIPVTKIDCIVLNSRLAIPTIGAFSQLLRLIAGADIVHIHSSAALVSFISTIAARLMHRTTIVTITSYLQMFTHHRPVARMTAFIVEPAVCLTAFLAQGIQVKNNVDYALLRAVRYKTRIIPDGIESCMYSPKRSSVNSREKYTLDTNAKILLYAGRLEQSKGLLVLLAALRQLLLEGEDFALLIAGRDQGLKVEMEKEIMRYGITSRVRFVGELDNVELIEAIDAADVVVIPSFTESFSIVASEAWSRGKPVAATKVGAMLSRVRDGRNGYLAKAGSARDLASAILKACSLERVEIPEDVVPWAVVAELLLGFYKDCSRKVSH